MKQFFLLSVFSIILAACGTRGFASTPNPLIQVVTAKPLANPAVTASPTLPHVHTGYLANVPTGLAPFLTQFPQAGIVTPRFTATPLVVEDSSLSQLAAIKSLFPDNACLSEDLLTPIAPAGTAGFTGYNIGEPEFINIANWESLQILDLDEIADSLSQSYRAFLVEVLGGSAECTGCVLQTKVLVQDRKNGNLYRIDWRGYEPRRVIFAIAWVGDNVLVFFQSLSPHAGDLVAIDVEKQRYVYYSLLSCP